MCVVLLLVIYNLLILLITSYPNSKSTLDYVQTFINCHEVKMILKLKWLWILFDKYYIISIKKIDKKLLISKINFNFLLKFWDILNFILFFLRMDVCNGICSVPTGYTSRCQQQYVQKRLVALQGNGNQLYTDIFWFPHGCSCEIIANYWKIN